MFAATGCYSAGRMLRHVLKYLSFALFLSAAAAAQNPADLRVRVRQYRQQHETEIIRQYADLLAIPNLASDQQNIHRNAERIMAMLQERGVQARLLQVADSPPIVFGELQSPGARHTLVMYAHYDG